MATVTSVQSGNWSSSLTWGGLLPANGDTVVISAGHTVVFDVDMSSWTNGVILRVYGKLVAPTAAGSYYLKLAGNSTVYNGGKIEWGTQQSPVPVTITMTLDFNNYVLDGDSHRGQLEIVCTDPPDAAKVAKFTAAASAGATRIYIDRDLRGQTYWQAGAYIFMTNPQRGNTEYKTVSAVGENYIDLSSGLSSSKTATAVLALCTRNIIFKNMLTGANASITNFASAVIAAYKESGDRLYVGNDNTLLVVGGCYDTSTTSYSSLHRLTCTSKNAVYINRTFIFAMYVVFTNSYFIGNAANSWQYFLILDSCKIWNCQTIIQGLCIIFMNCELYNHPELRQIIGLHICNCMIYGTSLSNCTGTIVNTIMSSSTISESVFSIKNSVVPTPTLPVTGHYIESYDHNQVSGAFRSWSAGGYCESISDPQGGTETGWIKLTLNSATLPGYYHIRHTVLPSKTLSVSLNTSRNE